MSCLVCHRVAGMIVGSDNLAWKAAARIGFYVAKTKVVMEGRIELLQYYREQNICNHDHKLENLGERSWEEA